MNRLPTRPAPGNTFRRSRGPLASATLALLLLLVLLPAVPLVRAGPAGTVAEDFTLEIKTSQPLKIEIPAQTGKVTLTLRNKTGNQEQFFLFTPARPTGWTRSFQPGETVTVNDDGSLDIGMQLTIPADTAPGTYVLTVSARKYDDRLADEDAVPQADATLVVQVSGPGQPGTAPPACPEIKDPGQDADHADQLLVDREEGHGLCDSGDEDWFKFGGLANKLYTIAITQMDQGLDLALELYDDQGSFLSSSDDNPTTGNYSDTKPLIKSFRAPRSGLYFVRVRDTLGLGGANRTYRIVVRGESYGDVPSEIPPNSSVCNDKYEQDGLPELATLVLPNETHAGHLLCPVGDADWSKFFGLANYTYAISTSTTAYGNPEPGADTIMFLFSRDGATLIGQNNNSGDTLDSRILFTPTVDGIYYVQVKNIGDTGNQFIAYDLAVTVCVPAKRCNLPGSEPPPEPAPAPDQPSPSGSAPADDDPVFLPASVEPSAPDLGFADVAFEQVWRRADQPVAQHRASRSWMWGPRPYPAMNERYTQAAQGTRQVQYFDKGRMELNNPQGDRASRWFVTSGLLVVEMMRGRIQVGDEQFESRAPADLPIAGDLDDPAAPTYASFAPATDRYVGNRRGQPASEAIDRDGQVKSYTGAARSETRLVEYVEQTGHNIPQVFWQYLTASGVVYENGRYRSGTLFDWVFTMGYPIAEPYWVRVRVGGAEHDVLVQPFERRVLTYMPDAPSGWAVQMGNVGRHYYQWRYGAELPAP